MSKIRLIERDTNTLSKNDPGKKAYHYKWEIQAPAKLFGKRLRKKFRTKAEANGYKLELEIKLQNQKLSPLDRDVHLCAYRFQNLLTVDQIETALSDAVVHYQQSEMDLQSMVGRYLDRLKKRYGRGHVGKHHLKLHAGTAPRLVEWLGNPKLREIDKEMCEEFIDDRISDGLVPRTARNYAEVLGAVLKQAVDDKMLSEHPMAAVEMPTVDSPVHILAPAELNKLLLAAPQVLKKFDFMTPFMMFGAFAGLRTSEIERLTWEDVRLDIGQLYVQKGKNKNSERWVVLTPPLLEWCEKMLGDGATGLVLHGTSPSDRSRAKKRLCRTAGVTIPRNALRHSYGSHHLVHHASEGNTAAEMGHYTAQMTFKAYRRAVTKVQAADYWNIRVD